MLPNNNNTGIVTAVSGSYLQDSRHENVSTGYNVIQHASVGQAMADHGLVLAGQSSGRARKETYANHQRTFNRYTTSEDLVAGVKLNVLHEGNHLGRGTDKIFLGFFVLLCSNGLSVGASYFECKIRHNGDTFNNLSLAIAEALGQRDTMREVITGMQAKALDIQQVRYLVDAAVSLLVPSGAVNIREQLTKVWRQGDASNSAWDVFNRIQENAMRGGMVGYDTVTTDDATGLTSVRHMTTRKIKAQTNRDIEFNREFFDIAAKIAA